MSNIRTSQSEQSANTNILTSFFFNVLKKIIHLVTFNVVENLLKTSQFSVIAYIIASITVVPSPSSPFYSIKVNKAKQTQFIVLEKLQFHAEETSMSENLKIQLYP